MTSEPTAPSPEDVAERIFRAKFALKWAIAEAIKTTRDER